MRPRVARGWVPEVVTTICLLRFQPPPPPPPLNPVPEIIRSGTPYIGERVRESFFYAPAKAVATEFINLRSMVLVDETVSVQAALTRANSLPSAYLSCVVMGRT